MSSQPEADRLTTILTRFDGQADPFEEIEIADAIQDLLQQRGNMLGIELECAIEQRQRAVMLAAVASKLADNEMRARARRRCAHRCRENRLVIAPVEAAGPAGDGKARDQH